MYNLSYGVALYYLYLFYLGTKEVLTPFRPVMKFLSVKLIVFLTFWQYTVVTSLDMDKELALQWNDFILCIEMVFFAIMLSIGFGYQDFMRAGKESDSSSVEMMFDGGGTVSSPRSTNQEIHPNETKNPGKKKYLSNMKEVLSVRDIVDDAIQSFKPDYQDYMVQRNDDEETLDSFKAKTFFISNSDTSIVQDDFEEWGSSGTKEEEIDDKRGSKKRRKKREIEGDMWRGWKKWNMRYGGAFDIEDGVQPEDDENGLLVHSSNDSNFEDEEYEDEEEEDWSAFQSHNDADTEFNFTNSKLEKEENEELIKETQSPPHQQQRRRFDSHHKKKRRIKSKI